MGELNHSSHINVFRRSRLPDGMMSNVRDLAVEDLRKLDQLRDELHTWAFENVGLVEKTYRRVYANKADCGAEIAAPLHTMSQICGDPELSAKLRAFRSVVPIQCLYGSCRH